MIKNIRILCWDFDGTLYRLSDQLWQEIFAAQYRVIMDHTGWNLERAQSEHAKLYKVVTPSSTDVVARLCGISITAALYDTEKYYDRTKYIHYDQQLVDMFGRLSGFRHIMFVNGQRIKEEPALRVLGISPGIFETWITPEQTGVVKPDPKHFQAILEYSKLPPELHLVIGDRAEVDLLPAKTMGMKTCLVWSDDKGKIADISLHSVYNLPEVLLPA